MGAREIPFRPKLVGDFRNRFYHAVSEITRNSTSEELELLCNREIAWVEKECRVNIEQRKKYRAICLLLRDLVRASWKAEFRDGVLLMRLPSVQEVKLVSNSATEAKALLRSWMRESRLEKLSLYTDFIDKMEQESNSKKSIRDLIADGDELIKRLRKAQSGQIDITEAVKPYLQLIDPEDPVDKYTGLKTADIWRYFRMTWSTPAENTPGRTMQYLIRDAAHPLHAVMGIASLENCAVAISSRDKFLGWTVSSFEDRIDNGKMSAEDAAQLFLSYLNEGICGIDYSDLCSEEEIEEASESTVQRLLSTAAFAENERTNILNRVNTDSEDGTIDTEVSVRLLFQRKRAEQLGRYLSAKSVIRDAMSQPDYSVQWRDFFNSDIGSVAIRTAITAQKSKHIGSSMLELNVCGAIPPYNEILGGKLVALLATSPQIVADYHKRYSNRKSEIASQMKGADVYRPADLVYIGTTSLYSVGSSQYNRLKIPAEAYSGAYPIEWKKIGETTGFGTLHISRSTTMALKESTSDASVRVNHIFGEGPSPKMRLLAGSIRELLETSTDDTKEFTKHAMSRIVFGVCLAKNTTDYLEGLSNTPEYLMDMSDIRGSTQKIVRFWQTRWLQHRLSHAPIFDRIASFDKEKFLVSNDVNNDTEWEFEKLKEEPLVLNDIQQENGLPFIRNFYRGVSSFADHTKDNLLTSVHVQTKLDRAVLQAVDAGKDVVLTGNPGDGKTHIIRIASTQLLSKNVHVVLDASTMTSEEVFREWVTARAEHTSFVIAINAAVLYSLAHRYPDFEPIQDAYHQMTNAVVFDENTNDDKGHSVLTFDLSRRNVLSLDVVKSIIEKLTDDQHYQQCQNCPIYGACGAITNRNLLRSPLFQRRLSIVFERIAIKGYHATLRELQGFIAYLIFGDRDCSKISKTNGAAEYELVNLIYSGKGKLFDAIISSFDPVEVSHPVWDEMILKNSFDQSGWDPSYPTQIESISPEREAEFTSRKRAFFFLHNDGAHLLEMLNDDVSNFQHYLGQKDKDLIHETLQKLNAFFGAKGEKSLDVWSGHRYNTSSRSILISSGALREKQFSVGKPRILPSMQSGMDMISNYVRLQLRSNPNVHLKVDFNMYKLLSDAENGLPVLFIHDSNLVKKVWRFMEKLQAQVTDLDDEEYTTISILDINNRSKYEVEVDIEDRVYKSVVKSTIGVKRGE